MGYERRKRRLRLREEGLLPHEPTCPKCKTILDAAQGLDIEADGEGKSRVPRQGSFSLCLHCGEFLRYTGGGFEAVSREELEAIAGKDDPRLEVFLTLREKILRGQWRQPLN